ncbi:MAG: PP2C family protein-serine/threonine phosphatase [Anaerolineales bacterium]
MEAPILERIRTGLLEKRVGLSEWLRMTPSHKKGVLLGPSTEQGVHAHLGAIDNSIAKAESGSLGRCEVCQDYVESDLLEIDYTASVCITHFSEEEVRHLETELELAQSVQKTLLPQEVPNIPGLEIAAFSRPAQIVGGDYFDFIEFGRGTHCLAIADVAGHGVSASLHMASIQALLRAIVPVNHSPAEVVRKIHKLFIHNIRFTTFVTFFIGAFDPTTKTFTYCNAGHNPPMVLQERKNGKDSIVWLNPTGPAIGLVEEAKFGEKTFDFHEGDLLMMYTDGVTEAVNIQNDEFGSERLAGIIKRLHQSPPKEVVRGIREGLEDFSEGKPLADDTTVVVCRIT